MLISYLLAEATGFGLVYYVEEMIKYAGKGDWKGKRVAISGSGNVAQYAALKCIELGASVVSLSDSKGCLVTEGDVVFTPKHIDEIAQIKLARQSLTTFSAQGSIKYIEGARPWVHVGKVDVALPCATENELNDKEAEALINNGTLFVAEGSNMGCTQSAIEVFEKNRKAKGQESVWYAPGKASNCGGVAVSGLEMAQNSQVRPLCKMKLGVHCANHEPVAHILDHRRGRRQAQGDYEGGVREWPEDRQAVRRGEGG